MAAPAREAGGAIGGLVTDAPNPGVPPESSPDVAAEAQDQAPRAQMGSEDQTPAVETKPSRCGAGGGEQALPTCTKSPDTPSRSDDVGVVAGVDGERVNGVSEGQPDVMNPTGEQSRADEEQGDDGGEHRENSEGPSGAEGKLISKNAQKKLLKQERNRERREKRREERRNGRENGGEAARKAAEEAKRNMTEAERLAAEQKARELQLKRQQAAEEKCATWRRALEGSPRVIIDLGFGDLMTSRELSSLQQQIMYSYGLNGRSATPCRLTLTSCQGPILANLERISGFDRWRLERHSDSYMDVFGADPGGRATLVYLTSDSDVELGDLEPGKAYIIGGIVDHNRLKKATADKARREGIATARLPVAMFPPLASSKVLTVNQVFEALLTYWSSKDWSKALQVAVPQRRLKNPHAPEDKGQEGDGARKRPRQA